MNMYNYIFSVIYNWAMNRDKGMWLSKLHACNGVFFALLVHVFLLLEIIKLFFGFNVSEFLPKSKNGMVVFVLLLFLAPQLFYTKSRIEKNQNGYSNKNRNKKGNGWIVAAIMFIPLIILLLMESMFRQN